MNVRKSKRSSTHNLKMLLPQITSVRKSSKDVKQVLVQKSKESPYKVTGKSTNTSTLIFPEQLLAHNRSSIDSSAEKDKYQSPAKDSSPFQGINFAPLGNLFATTFFDPDGDVTTKTTLCQSMTELALSYTNQKLWDNLLLVMEEIEANCLTYQARPLVSGFYKVYATILLELSEYARCLIMGKKMLADCSKVDDYPGMLFAYEKIGEAYSAAQNFEESLRCFFLMLKVALKLRDYRKELSAYDKIGLQYFNLNQMDRGEYFHMRMVDCRLEKDDSILRNMHFARADGSKFGEMLEEDLQDLAAVFFEPMAVDAKYRGFDEKRRKIIAYMDEVQNPIRRVGNIKFYTSIDTAAELGFERLAKASYGRKPTNCPLASLAHYSANRSVKVLDSVSGSDPKGTFRFLRFGKQLRPSSRKLVQLALQEYLNTITNVKMRTIRTLTTVPRGDSSSSAHKSPM